MRCISRVKKRSCLGSSGYFLIFQRSDPPAAAFRQIRFTLNPHSAAKVEKNIKEFFIGGDSLPSLLIAVCT
jgi:hypothetical protein